MRKCRVRGKKGAPAGHLSAIFLGYLNTKKSKIFKIQQLHSIPCKKRRNLSTIMWGFTYIGTERE